MRTLTTKGRRANNRAPFPSIPLQPIPKEKTAAQLNESTGYYQHSNKKANNQGRSLSLLTVIGYSGRNGRNFVVFKVVNTDVSISWFISRARFR